MNCVLVSLIAGIPIIILFKAAVKPPAKRQRKEAFCQNGLEQISKAGGPFTGENSSYLTSQIYRKTLKTRLSEGTGL